MRMTVLVFGVRVKHLFDLGLDDEHAFVQSCTNRRSGKERLVAAVMVDQTTHELPPYVAPAAPRTRAWVFWRRRLVAVGLLVMALTIVAPRFRAALGGAPASAPEGGPVPISFVVESGDSLWSIARRIQPVGDPRALVARLEIVAGGAELRPGQVLTLGG
jgi:hypothetical protein